MEKTCGYIMMVGQMVMANHGSFINIQMFWSYGDIPSGKFTV
jgi:hypothetical protein